MNETKNMLNKGTIYQVWARDIDDHVFQCGPDFSRWEDATEKERAVLQDDPEHELRAVWIEKVEAQN